MPDRNEHGGDYPATNPAHPTIIRPAAVPLSRIRLIVPTPPVELQINKRLGRSYGYTLLHKRQAKNDAFWAFYAVVGPDPPEWRACAASVTFHITHPSQRLDPDGALGWLKHTQDQLAICLGINDRYFRWDQVIWNLRPDRQRELEIELWDDSAAHPGAVRPKT